MSKTIAFIPVRGGSKSIPLKNIKPFCGKPLVYWTVKAAQDCKYIDEVIVATDSKEIEDTVLSFRLNKVKVYERSTENAQDHSSTESVVLEYITNKKVNTEDTFVLVQATSPLLTSFDIENGINIYNNQDFDSLLSCVREKRFYWNNDGTPNNYDFTKRPRRQDFNGILMENGAFYIQSVKGIIKNQNRLGGNIGITELPYYTSVEIDEEDDWIIAEKLMHKHILSSNDSKKKIKLILSDVDGVLTDAGMYYSENGDELKKFNTRDGMAFQLCREAGLKTGIITSENTELVTRRGKKMKLDFVVQGKAHGGKLNTAISICKELNISLDEVAYIGDDINCKELLSKVGLAACPNDAMKSIQSIHNIIILEKQGGEGCVREFVENYILI
ncbi:acylneuraminate cytidylyltransferase [Flammeovirga pacifica]|uniref:N-acylneuraminate cytidylyltransferase n=1 Tax=Flammeovirga pacifica TaxID=915059 RepID=A0A1S1YXF8_FLAPC|nr:acylneuraminate cytidylyltransferase [Flammeovirga pacifica]OHX65697.1 acylneuraminate cytidylyltransferase [Flammeovirga pacifica]